MKKLYSINWFKTFFLLALYSTLSALMSCEVAEETICGKAVKMKKYVQEVKNENKDTRVFYKLDKTDSEDIYDLEIEFFFEADFSDPGQFTENEIKDTRFTITTDTDTKGAIDKMVLFWNKSKSLTSSVLTSQDPFSGYQGNSFVSGHHKEPVITIKFVGECAGESVTEKSEHLEVDTEISYVPSAISISSPNEIEPGTSISLSLISNNEDDAEKVVTITSSLGDSEDVVLESKDGLFSGYLPTQKSSTKGTENDKVLNVASGGKITVTYEDNLDESGAKSPLSATIDIPEEKSTCDDGVKNGDETGVDCGGSCDACPACDDGKQNGDETGVDCGGTSCSACPTCDDGVMNGDETGVDCGGSCGNTCDGEITLGSTVYTLDDSKSSTLPYEFEGVQYNQYDMGTVDAGGNTDLFISLEFYSTTVVDDGTYTVADYDASTSPEGITPVISSVSTGNGATSYAVNGGTATLSNSGTTITLNLTTDSGGNLTGTYTYPP